MRSGENRGSLFQTKPNNESVLPCRYPPAFNPRAKTPAFGGVTLRFIFPKPRIPFRPFERRCCDATTLRERP